MTHLPSEILSGAAYLAVRSDPLEETIRTVAEGLSLYLQPSDEKPEVKQVSVAHPGTAFQCLLALGALFSINLPDWFTDQEISFFAQKCYQHQYQGDWAKVQILLEQCTNFLEYKAVVLEMYSSRDFYGNILRGIVRYQKTIRGKKDEQHGPVRRKVRRRGYNDKGTCASPWWNPKTGDVAGSPKANIPKIDRRGYVKNSLLRLEKNFPEGTMAEHRVAEQLALLVDLAEKRKEVVTYVDRFQRSGSFSEIQTISNSGEPDTDRLTSEDAGTSEIETFQAIWNASTLAKFDPEEDEDRNRDQGSHQSLAKTAKASA